MNRVGQHDVEHKRRAKDEHERRRQQERQERIALVLVEARRHEHPDLRGDDRKGETHAAERADLGVGEERLVQRGVNQVIVRLALERGGERPCQEAVDRAREIEADEEAHDEGQDRDDQPLAQLDMMFEQRRLGRLDRGFIRIGRLVHGCDGPAGTGSSSILNSPSRGSGECSTSIGSAATVGVTDFIASGTIA